MREKKEGSDKRRKRIREREYEREWRVNWGKRENTRKKEKISRGVDEEKDE